MRRRLPQNFLRGAERSTSPHRARRITLSRKAGKLSPLQVNGANTLLAGLEIPDPKSSATLKKLPRNSGKDTKIKTTLDKEWKSIALFKMLRKGLSYFFNTKKGAVYVS